MSNLIAKKLILITTAQRASSVSLPASEVSLYVGADNTGVAYLIDDDGTDIPLPRGEVVPLGNVDLYNVRVRGTLNDLVMVYGTKFADVAATLTPAEAEAAETIDFLGGFPRPWS